jgi:hypothetical protein
MKQGTIWLPADTELPVRVERTTANEKRILIAFWGIHGIVTIAGSQKIAHSIHHSFMKKCSVHSLRTCSQIPKQTRKPFTLIHMDNTRVHIARTTQEKLDGSRVKRMLQPPYSPDIAPSYFFGWLKTQLERREYHGEELFEVLDETLTGLSIEMVETVFVDWTNRLQRLIDGNGDYIS